MMLNIHRFTSCAAFLALFVAVGQTRSLAADAQESPAERQRKLIAVLQSGATPAEKAITCKKLAIYGTKDAVPALAALLLDKDLLSWARIALESIPGPEADAALRDAVGKVQGRMLIGVINSLGVRRDPKALELLSGKLNDPDTEVASAAAAALGSVGGEQAVRTLEQSLSDGPVGIRSAVAEGLILCAERALAANQSAEAVRLYDTVRKTDLPKQRIIEATRGAILARKAEGIPLLLETLRSQDKATYGIGLRTARELPGRAVTEALAAELGKMAPDRQGPMLLALADRGDAAALPAVFNAARTGSKSLRLAAVSVIERLGSGDSVPVLVDLTADADADLAKAARAGLARLPGKDVDAAIVARLPQSSGGTRRVLVELAGQRHVSAAVPELVKAAGDADTAIRNAGVKALGQTVTEAELGSLTALLGKAKSEDEVAAVDAALESACTRNTNKLACSEKLLEAFQAASTTAAKCSLLRVLGIVGHPRALETVQAAVASPDAAVNDAAVRSLADWPEAAAFHPLFDVFRKTKNDTHRILALRNCVRLLSLGGQPTQQTIKTYGELLASSQRAEDRKMVLAGLAGLPDVGALKLIEPMLADTAVQAEAELASLTIASALLGTAPAEAKAVITKLQSTSKNERTKERAAQLLNQAGKVEDFITAWQYCGPYTEADQGGPLFDTAFAPEWMASKAGWRPLPTGTQEKKPWMLDFLAAMGGQRRVGYARTWVFSDKVKPARIEYGTDDGNKLWFNGKIVHQANRGGAAVPGDFKAAVELRQGWNAIVLKVIQDTGPWEFCLRIRDAAGGKLDGLRVQATPPE